jgi:hypothetical protein
VSELFPGRVGVSIRELADATGWSRDTVERAITRGDLVAFGWPGSRRITVDSIRAFVARGVKGGRAQITTETPRPTRGASALSLHRERVQIGRPVAARAI